MKANELMIGDWVFLKNGKVLQTCQVTVIGNATQNRNDIGKYVCLDMSDEFPTCIFEIDEISPIPITPEILEKNGFEVQDQGGGRKDVWTGFGIDYEGDIEVEFQYNVPVYLKIDGGFKGEYYTSANIKYIHQLQHALRLCGIEKEIIL